MLASKTILRNGASYVTEYNNYDTYGNPTVINEYGPNGGFRSTTLSYYIDSNKWIINQVLNQNYIGSKTLRSFDSRGNLIAKTVDGVTTNYTYDSQGNIASISYPRGLVHLFSNYFRGLPQTEYQPEGINIYRVVSQAGNVVSETNGNGFTTSYDYDGLNRITRISPPQGNAVFINYGSTSKTATRDRLSQTTQYDGFNNPSSVALGGVVTTYKYDALGRLTFESNPGDTIGKTTEYDILDRVVKTTNPDNTEVKIRYDAGMKLVTDERKHTTQYSYRAYGNPDQPLLVHINAPDPSGNISLVHNARDMITSITQGGVTRGFKYNSKYYLISETSPETGKTIYERDDAGNMLSRTVGASPRTSFSYDNQNRLTKSLYPGSNIIHTYDKTSKSLSISSKEGGRLYTYNSNGDLISEVLSVDGNNFEIRYILNGNDHLVGMYYPQTNTYIDYAPDVLGRPTAIRGFISEVTYWPSGQLKQLTYANGIKTNYGQNNRLLPSYFNISRTMGSTYTYSIYSYDDAGNLVRIGDSIDSSYNRILQYDKLNRLVSASGPWGTNVITYDGLGNVTSQSSGTSTLKYNYVNNKVSSLSGYKNSTYSYDAYGNIINDSTNSYLYNDVPKLVKIKLAGNKSIQYTYDGSGARTSLLMDADRKIYEVYASNGNLITELQPGLWGYINEYVYIGSMRVAQITISDPLEKWCGNFPQLYPCPKSYLRTFFHNDLSGSPMVATDTSGGVSWRESYRPYGDRFHKQAAGVHNKIWYAGKPQDDVTGLSFMVSTQSRDVPFCPK